jgi:cyclophilin family peptidyl-prolyl cis-trans isomerase
MNPTNPLNSRVLLAGAVVLALAGSAFAQASKPADDTPPAKNTTPATPAEPAKAPATAPAPAPAEEKLVYVKFTVSFTDPATNASSTGDIVLELNETKAPISTRNFVQYVEDGHYTGTVFHRIIDGFMIQGGGFTENMQQKKTRDPIKNEWQNGLKNQRGTIAMARTAIADSATSQFFINVVDNPALDTPRDGAAYAVFGRVVSGMEIVDKLRKVPTGNRGGHQNVPVQPVTITQAARVQAPAK